MPLDKTQKSFMGPQNNFENPELFLANAQQFSRLMMMYRCAIREVETKFEVLNDDLSLQTEQNPIEYIQSRIKKPLSIAEKLQRRNLPLTLDSIKENLNDVAGIRVVCTFIDDIYNIAEMLIQQDDITVIEIKDYIKNPKPNGYRSYHMIVEVPVFFSDKKLAMRVEVQIRTMAMDFWASLEHQLKYKKNVPNEDIIKAQLKDCADVINSTDQRMQDIRHNIHYSDL